jgi:hypothetical protein
MDRSHRSRGNIGKGGKPLQTLFVFNSDNATISCQAKNGKNIPSPGSLLQQVFIEIRFIACGKADNGSRTAATHNRQNASKMISDISTWEISSPGDGTIPF